MEHPSLDEKIDKITFHSASEELVILGYRFWSFGAAYCSEEHIKQCWDLHLNALHNPTHAKTVQNALALLVKTLNFCAACPLKTSPKAQNSVTEHERLIVSLVAAFHHDDGIQIKKYLSALSCGNPCPDVAFAAEQYAFSLKLFGHVIIPSTRSVANEHAAYNLIHRQ